MGILPLTNPPFPPPLLFSLAWMRNRVNSNNWKNTAGDGGNGWIMYSVSCYFSLIFSSVFAWPHSTQPVFCSSHGAVSLPQVSLPLLPSPRGVWRQEASRYTQLTNTLHIKRTQTYLENTPHLTLCLQPPAETLTFSSMQSCVMVELTSNFCVKPLLWHMGLFHQVRGEKNRL